MNANMFLTAKDATEAWEYWYVQLQEMANKGFAADSRDGGVVGEILNAITVIEDPTRGIIQSSIRKMPMRYAVGELLWYLSGSNRTRDISLYSDVWGKLSDDGETNNSAYGHRIHHRFGFDQWEFVKDKLTKNPNDRQCVIHIKDASNEKTKDTPCTVALQFLLRENKLYMTTYMRSNDIWTGFPYDVFAFTAMQVKMAFELGVELGTYTHIAGSLHLYERNWLKEAGKPAADGAAQGGLADA
jgi:thymidylate synthase